MGGEREARILLAAGELALALELVVLLDRLGCGVLGPVASAAEALVLLRHERPDAALLAVRLRDGLVVPVADRLTAMGVPFALTAAREARRLRHPSLAGVPSLREPLAEEGVRRVLADMLAAPPA